MRVFNKNGLLIDTCPQCRGVWLDRNALEKLAGFGGFEDRSLFASSSPPRADWSRRRDDDDDDDDDDRRRKHDQPRRRRKSLLDLFD